MSDVIASIQDVRFRWKTFLFSYLRGVVKYQRHKHHLDDERERGRGRCEGPALKDSHSTRQREVAVGKRQGPGISKSGAKRIQTYDLLSMYSFTRSHHAITKIVSHHTIT
jgi:hypothetical protein